MAYAAAYVNSAANASPVGPIGLGSRDGRRMADARQLAQL